MTQPSVACAVMGPAGVGKSCIDAGLQVASRVEPHRVREHPRSERDIYYLSEAAYAGIVSLLARSGPTLSVACPDEEPIEVYEDIVLFSARRRRQVLFLPNDTCTTRKIKIFGPVINELLKLTPMCARLASLFADQLFFLFLNPWAQSFREIDPENAANPATPYGQVLQSLLQERGDSPREISDRISGIGGELRAWTALQALEDGRRVHVLEVRQWSWPEYRFTPQNGASLLQEAIQGIREAAAEKFDQAMMDVFLQLFAANHPVGRELIV